MTRCRTVSLVALMMLLPLVAEAQVRPVRPAPPTRPVTRADSLRARRDTIPRDSTGADTVNARLRLSEPDSVMRALMNKPGYTVTRYEGQLVTFDASNQMFQILGVEAKRAIVQRDSQVVVTDSSIIYNEKSKIAIAAGNTIVLHDPTSGQGDVVANGNLTYDLSGRSARITNPVISVNTGEQWQIRAHQGKIVLPDSSKRAPTFYGLGGQITSCTDSIPDYHFEFNEVKRSGENTLVARPAVLYIRDIPVMWLPFLFQDTRGGRHSGILTPRFGISDIIRSSPNYRRSIEGLGYYFAINDYVDASTWLDWRSASGGNSFDPGWTRLNGEFRYNWLDRFVRGNLASSYERQRDGQTNLKLNLVHGQEFTRDRKLSANVNYVTSTRLQRQNTFNPYAVLATIRSQATYSDKIGPATLQLGGSRTQYPGRDQIDQQLPTLSLTTGTLSPTSWLAWTPSFSYNASQTLHIDQPGPFAYRYFRNSSNVLDSTLAKRNSYTSALSFDTPLKIFGYDLRNSFRVNERLIDFPQTYTLTDPETGAQLGSRVYPNDYATEIDWTPDFQLPPFARSLFNLTPSVSLQNVTSGPFWVRTNLSNGQFVHQAKRATFAVSASPTIFGLLPGFGPFSRFRHSIQPSMGYSYAPKADVSAAYLQALGRSKASERNSLGLQQNLLTFGLSQNIEGKVRSANDTSPDQAEKIKLLMLQFSPLSYDIDRARSNHSAIRGFTTDRFSYTVRSELLPNFDFGVDYSLFEGSPNSDTARFSPYRERISANFSLSKGNNPFVVLAKLFGRAVPADQRPDASGAVEDVAPRADEALARQLASQPVAGSRARSAQFLVPNAQGWSASFNFSSARQRPFVGNSSNVIELDPRVRCEELGRAAGSSIVTDACLAQLPPDTQSPIQSPIVGATIYRSPPVTNLGGNFSFSITPKWAATWNTSYDFVRHEFAQHMVTLQRDLHDWRAVFAFTQSANGNFAFNFFIALKAEPDLKFDYNRNTIRSQTGFP